MKDAYTDGFFNVSRDNGFLPVQTSLKKIPEDYKSLLDLCNELPYITKNNQLGILHYPNLICEKVKELPNLIEIINTLETINFTDRVLILQVLFRCYSFLVSSYCLEPTYNSYIKDKTYEKARTVIPQNIAEPYCKISELLGCYPWLEYHYSYGLGNFTILNHKANYNYELEDIEVESLFCGDKDEINFIKVHILINLCTPSLITYLYDIFDSIEKNRSDLIIEALKNLNTCVHNMNEKRKLMWKNSNTERYGAYRIFLMGSEGNDKIFGDGLLYENVKEERVKYRGETGAQDDIIPTLDIFTGITKFYPDTILTKYLHNLRDYRPKVIIDFFNDLEKESINLKDRIFSLCGKRGLIYLLSIVNEIYLFRNGHWQFVQNYIMNNTEYNVATGGTPLNMWLPNQIKACLDCMDDILFSINEPKFVSFDTELEGEDILLLGSLRLEQDRKRRLLDVQMNELKKKMCDLQKIIGSNKEFKDNSK